MQEKSVFLTEEEILNLPNDSDLGYYIRKKYLNELRITEENKFVEYDHCVICGKQSPYTKQTNIFERIGYVEGGGQGCFQQNSCNK